MILVAAIRTQINLLCSAVEMWRVRALRGGAVPSLGPAAAFRFADRRRPGCGSGAGRTEMTALLSGQQGQRPKKTVPSSRS
jgi:hypothetical protein